VNICVIFWIQLRYPRDAKFEKKMRKMTIDYSLALVQIQIEPSQFKSWICALVQIQIESSHSN